MYITLPTALLADETLPTSGQSGERLLFMCEEVEFPGRQIATTEQRIYGPQRKMPYDMTYPETSITFRVATTMFERTLFDKWQDLIINPWTNNVGYYKDYATPIQIFQANTDEIGYDRKGPKGIDQPGLQLNNAYPVSLSSLQYSTTADNAYHRQAVTFNYHTWKRIESKDAPSLSSQLQIKDVVAREKEGPNFKPTAVLRRIFGNLTGI